ncbi:MAG TPA: hypothetical protein VGD63_09520 [Steroidobacteraceae bacterium]
MNKMLVGAGLAGTLLIAACSSQNRDWDKATRTNTLGSYQAFLQQHPDSEHAAEARGFVLAFADDAKWKAAQNGGSIQSYQDYLHDYPGGLRADRARFQITALQRAAAWKSIQSDLTPSTLQEFLKTYPQGPESNLARERLADLSYRVRLAESGTKRAAERRRAQLQSRFRGVVPEVIVMPPATPGTKYVIASGLMSQSGADSACKSIGQEHQQCVVIKSDTSAGQS